MKGLPHRERLQGFPDEGGCDSGTASLLLFRKWCSGTLSFSEFCSERRSEVQ